MPEALRAGNESKTMTVDKRVRVKSELEMCNEDCRQRKNNEEIDGNTNVNLS